MRFLARAQAFRAPHAPTGRAAAAAIALTFAAIAPARAQSPDSATGLTLVGRWEGEAETTRWPLFLDLRLRREAASLAATLRVLGQTVSFNVARAVGDSLLLRSGDGPRALVIAAAIHDGALRGQLMQGTDTLPLVLHPVPVYPRPRDRAEGWGQDLDALATRFLTFDRSFSLAERASFLEAIEETRRRVSELNDHEIIMRMAAAVALARNAHTRLYLLRNRTELRRLPVRLWWFADGLYVVRATPAYRRLLGCRVDDFAGIPARHARDLVAPLFAGTPSWVDYKSVYSLTSPEVLHGVGITPSADSVALGVSGCTGASGRQILEPLPLAKSDDAVEAWWDLSPVHQPEGTTVWVHRIERSHELPLYLRYPDRHYWFEYLPENGILYVHYSRSSNMRDETTKQFGERLLAELDRRRPTAFVLDLRFNTGGNLSLGADLMKALQERTRGIPRFVITGRATFSAGITHAASWREAGHVTFVGESVGDDLEFWSEGGNIELPHSGFDAHFANGFHSYSERPCPRDVPCHDLSAPALGPDVPVWATWSDYVEGRDPAMAAILQALGRSATRTGR